ncbi:MAG TPA: substrate-binding domain-containing protein, partial [Mycobacterium sp.]|nr:substrate-binding domain-containing protein [Mycobacterium sp.]
LQDDVGGGYEAGRHLISHGHRSIAFMGDDTFTGLLRLKGLENALDDAGLAQRSDLTHVGAIDTPTLTAELRRMLAAPDPPSAVFSSNARVTIALVTALQALRRKDIGLVGFGDFPTAAALRPAVTVIHQDGDEMGRFAADRLFTRFDQPARRLRRRTVLPVSLVTRASCSMPGEKVRAGHGDVVSPAAS